MKKILPLILLVALSLNSFTQPLLSFDTVLSGLSSPVDVVEVNDSSRRLFIVERTGKIRVWKEGRLLPSPFLDVATIITTANGEQGLLSLAFHPDYKTNGYFFIYYTNTAGSITVARYNRSNDSIADPLSATVLLTIPKRFANHNGGNLVFGSDGFLYFGTGDGGSGGDPDNNAQNGQSLLGKMLRLDVNNPNPPFYRIPSTNPFIGSSTTREEIIATGLRNPWRWSFDKQTGDMWIADVGQNAWEEVNVVSTSNVLNKDYGWSCFEGTHSFKGCAAKANNIFPIFEYPHNNTTGGRSITGGYVYRGTEFPSLQGYYICSDFISRNGWLIKPDKSGGFSSSMQSGWPAISSFGESADGTLYAVTLSGTILRVIASTPLPLHIVFISGQTGKNGFELQWQVQNETEGAVYIIEKSSKPSEGFTEFSRVRATANHTTNTYSTLVPANEKQAFYRVKMMSPTGQIEYSAVTSYQHTPKNLIKASIIGTYLRVTTPNSTQLIELFDASGKVLLKKKVNTGEHIVIIPLATIAKGILTIRATVNNERHSVQMFY